MNNIQQAELDDARLGTLYFLGKIKVTRQPSFDIGLIGNFSSGTTVLTDLKHGAETVVNSCSAGRKVLDGLSQYTKPIRELMASFMDALTEMIFHQYGEYAAALEWVGEFGTWAVSSLVGSLADIIPGWGYVQAAADLYEGVKKSVLSAIKWLTQVASGWRVKLLEGGPSIIARALALHNAAGVASGLKDIAITSISTGLQAATDAAAGVGAIVNAVTGILQRIANLVCYCVQRFLLNKTINQAGFQWNNEGVMKTHHQQFNQWYQKAVLSTPVVAALTMISGFVGNPIRFLALINPDGEMIEQSQFDQGVKHIDKLKNLSSDYLKTYADCYKLKFSSDDKLVSARLSDALK